MISENPLIIENQLRKHFKPTIGNFFRRLIILRKCSNLGQGIIVDNNVKILRFAENISIGNNVILKEGTRLCTTNSKSKLSIGARTSLGYHTMIFSTKNISIGSDCMIAPFCYIIDSNHQMKKNILLNKQPIEARDVKIKSDVWLGTGVKVLSGVTINRGAVIAAGSVVNNDVPENEIYAGIPAKRVGERQ